MIFVAVGTQLPFDRLIKAVDQWAALHTDQKIVAQIAGGKYRPRHIQAQPFMDAELFHKHVKNASLLVTHAGMGCIITALELGKPIIVVPRKASLGEHRNDHQLATAQRFLDQGRIEVAFHENELSQKLDRFCDISIADRIPPHASPDLLHVLSDFAVSDHPITRPNSRWHGVLRYILQKATR